MLVEYFFTAVSWLFTFIELLPLPSISQSIQNSITSFYDKLFSNVGLVGIFFNVPLLQICLTLIIGISSAEFIYRLIMWVLKKLPFLGIK